MKAKRLVLCLLLSIALIATFTPVVSFADTDDDEYEMNDFSDFEDLNPTSISVGGTNIVNQEGLFQFDSKTSGMYVFSTSNGGDADIYGRLLNANGEELDNDAYAFGTIGSGNDFRILFKAEAGKTYYLQAINYYDSQQFNVHLAKSDITGFTFEPAGTYVITRDCDVADWDYYISSEKGDKMTISHENGSKTTYIHKHVTYTYSTPDGEEGDDVDAFFNENDELLDGYYPSFDNSAVESSFKGAKPGVTKTVKCAVYYAGMKTNVSVKVKTVLWHLDVYDEKTDEFVNSIKKTGAVSATCTKAGNKEYWRCETCGKYYSDAECQNEIAKGSWVLPAKHKTTHKTTPAGLLKNGEKYDLCTVCGKKLNASVIPGWAPYYVKGLKYSKGKGSITVKWKKQSKANLKKFNGYQVRYATKSDMSNAKYATAGKSSKSKKIGKLNKKTNYFVQVRTFTKTKAGTFYSKWSAKKTVKTK